MKTKTQTLFTELFGKSSEIKVLDFLLIHRNYDYSLTEIARNANVGWTTINHFWKDWVKKEFVTKTRRIGRAQLYELNQKHGFVKKVMELHDNTLKEFLDKEIAKSKIKIRGREANHRQPVQANILCHPG
ncbi:MAG TPA: hypothetical protein VJ461_01245 [Candidatus Nanoarchaeia archaeon]|nr:hypothetical protein [Candidatus Nanoarchaeia archaeon]